MCLHWSVRYSAEEITRTPDSLIQKIIICLYNQQWDTPIVNPNYSVFSQPQYVCWLSFSSSVVTGPTLLLIFTNKTKTTEPPAHCLPCLQEQGQQGVTSRDDTRHGKAAEGPVRQSALPAGGGGGGQLRRRRPVSAALSLCRVLHRGGIRIFGRSTFPLVLNERFRKNFFVTGSFPRIRSRDLSICQQRHRRPWEMTEEKLEAYESP